MPIPVHSGPFLLLYAPALSDLQEETQNFRALYLLLLAW